MVFGNVTVKPDSFQLICIFPIRVESSQRSLLKTAPYLFGLIGVI